MIPYRTTAPAALVPVVTLLLIVVNAGILLLVESMPEEGALRIAYIYGLVPAFLSDPALAVRSGIEPMGVTTLLTNTFMHGGILHLVLNMWTLWLFGAPIEGRLGSIRFFFFYLACGVGGSAGHLLFNLDSTVPAVGASGAVAGILGGFMVLYPSSRVALMLPILFIPFFFQVPAVLFAVIWFVIQLTQGWTDFLRGGLQGGGIAWWAHIAGFLAGVALIRPFDPWGGPRRRAGMPRGPWG